MTRITVVGSFAVGITIRTGKMPIFGETLVGRDFDLGPGGKGSNQSVGTARLGASSSLVTCLGEDQLADYAKRRGVELETARRWLSPNLDESAASG